jgi:hypothetical protein
MDPREYLDYLRILHGAYDSLMMTLFRYQGRLGLKIRRMRKAGGVPDFSLIRRHGKLGPLFALPARSRL